MFIIQATLNRAVTMMMMMMMIVERSEAAVNDADSDAEIPSDTVRSTIRKLELVCCRFDIAHREVLIAQCITFSFMFA